LNSVLPPPSTPNGAITLFAGATYDFVVNAVNHPFWIKNVQGTGSSNGVPGVTNNGAESGTVTWYVPIDAKGPYFYNCGNHAAMTGTITVMNITVDMADTVYNVNTQGFTAYLINGVANPALTLFRGYIYAFNLNYTSNHPFWIKTVAGTGNANGLPNGATNGRNGGDYAILFISKGAPANWNSLSYNCALHAGMTGTITIVNPPTSSSSALSSTAAATGPAGSTAPAGTGSGVGMSAVVGAATLGLITLASVALF